MKIVNVVAKAELNKKLDIHSLSLNVGVKTKYNPKKFKGASAKFNHSTIIFFESGILLSVGCKTVKHCRIDLECIATLLNTGITSFKICNLVCSGDLKREICIGRLSNDTRIHSITWEPEIFPGAYIKIKPDDPLLVLFGSGKFYVTGSANYKKVKCMSTALNDIVNSLSGPH